jgi:hypothetical protein
MAKRELYLVILLACANASAQLAPKLPDHTAVKSVYDSVRGRTFRVTDPVGCVVYGGSGEHRSVVNQCTFPVEVAVCVIGSVPGGMPASCSDDLDKILSTVWQMKPGLGSPSWTSDPPSELAIVACPLAGVIQGDYVQTSTPTSLWTVERTGGAISGKCLEERGNSARAEERYWPLYRIFRADEFTGRRADIPLKISK